MTDKQIIIDASQCEWRTGVEHCGDYECMLNKCCDYNCDWYKRRKLEQQLKRKEQECEELKRDVERWKSNFNGKVSAIEELLQQLDQLKAENEELRKSITKIFACLIKANRGKIIIDTLWVDGITTLWDYIALTLGLEGDQTHIEEQILQKIS